MTAYDTFRESFFKALFWSETCEDDEGNDSCGWENFKWADYTDLETEGATQLDADCKSFWKEFVALVGKEAAAWRASKAGSDFCFTRNGHGVGFWDGDWPRYGSQLTKMGKLYGSCHLMYQGENVPIHVHS